MTTLDPRAWSMLEDRGPDSLDAHVRRLMADLGLEGMHVRNSIGSAAGFPDWEIWGTWIMHRELKTESGTVSQAQWHVGSLINRAGGDWGIWRPRDYYSGTIEAELTKLAAKDHAA